MGTSLSCDAAAHRRRRSTDLANRQIRGASTRGSRMLVPRFVRRWQMRNPEATHSAVRHYPHAVPGSWGTSGTITIRFWSDVCVPGDVPSRRRVARWQRAGNWQDSTEQPDGDTATRTGPAGGAMLMLEPEYKGSNFVFGGSIRR